MNPELIDIRSDEASSCCLRRGLAPATMTLLFHLTCETITTRRQTTSPDSRPRINAYLVRPVVVPNCANTYLAGSRTYPSTSPQPVTPGAGAISPSVPSHAITRSAVMPYLPVNVLTAKGPASTADHTSPALRQDAHVRHAPAGCAAQRCWGRGSRRARC